jgi:TonB-dependent receptor
MAGGCRCAALLVVLAPLWPATAAPSPPDLATTLLATAKRLHIEILFDRSAVAGLKAVEVPRKGDPDAILGRLLDGTGLIVRREGSAYIIVRPATAGAPPPLVERLPEIVVTGYRASLVEAIAIKRAEPRLIDVIDAEDISAFPDLNLAESIQRMPGVAITRDAGEGRQIVIRGLDPDLVRTHLDGMEVLGNTASGMDNRGAVERTRAFDYSLFASELFSRVTIEKSFSAQQDEGGIAGTVLLRTPQPFDYPGLKLALTAKAQTNDNVPGRITPRVAALATDRWGDFGALISIAYGVNESNEYGYRNYSWTQIHIAPANIGPGVSAADAARLTATDDSRVFAPQADTYSTWFTRRERLGTTVALQYQPDPTIHIDLNGLYSRLRNERHDYVLAASGTNSLTGDVTGTQILQSDVIAGDSLIAARYTGVDLRSEANVEVDTTNFYQGVLHATLQPFRRLTLEALAGYSESDYRLPVFDKVFLEARNQSFGFDDRPSMPVNSYGFDTADPAQWDLMRLDAQENAIRSTFRNLRLDAAFAASGTSTLRFGIAYKRFSNSGTERIDKQFYNSPTDRVIADDLKQTVPYDTLQNYVVGKIDAIYALVGQNRNLPDADTVPGTDYAVIEHTKAAYLQYDLATWLAGVKIDANIGVRYFHTAFASTGALGTGASEASITYRHRYSAFLPAFNLRAGLSDKWVLRLSASRDISRPTLSDLAAATTLTTAPFGGSITMGNPDLKPFTANAAEGAVEYYQSRIGFASIGLFYKKLNSFITREIDVLPYASTGLPLSYLLPGETGSTLFDVSRPVNGPGASIFGIEIALRRDFDFLPAPFDHLGIVFNATRINGSTPVLFDGRSVRLSLINLSKEALNATLYYETTKWGARISETHRSPYLIGISGDGNIGSGIKATDNVDFAAHYNLTGHLKLTAEGINLTNQHIVQFTDIFAKRTVANTGSGRTFLIGAAADF